MAGFSLRAALTARALLRLGRWVVVTATGSGVEIGAPGLSCPTLSTASAVAKSALGVASTSAPPLLLFRFRLFREVKSAAFGSFAGASLVASTSVTGVSVADNSVSKLLKASAFAGVLTAAYSSVRGSRPGPLRRPPRCTCSELVTPVDSLLSGSASRFSGELDVAVSAVESDTSVKSAAVISPAAKRSAFLRAVRFAPPRERRFFFCPGSSLPSATSTLGAVMVVPSSVARSILSESTAPGRVVVSANGWAASCSSVSCVLA